jgi:DNA sulfur modification protein DndD
MYLSSVQLTNWRSYADATFQFRKPTEGRPVVLIGAMNGHGKTSFLISLYLGLFGGSGLRYCEGFRLSSGEDMGTYRKDLASFRRRTASPDEPTIVDLTFTPTLNNSTEEEEVRITRRWHFSPSNQPKPGDAFEEAEVYVGDRVLRRADLATTRDRIEKYLFPAHVAPAFFFDGEQAQALIENMGGAGLKKAVEVMFGTEVVTELAEQMRQYLSRAHSNAGGKRKGSEKQAELNEKLRVRDELNSRIGKLQSEHSSLEKENEELARQRAQVTEEFAKLGGAAAKDATETQVGYVKAEREKTEAERAVSDAIRALGLTLAVSRMAIPVKNRLQAEELLETWEGLKRGTLEKKEAVLAAALPEPPETDPLLGNLSREVRQKVRERFATALERIYEPPPEGCAREYLLGHVKGEMRAKLLQQLGLVQSQDSSALRALGKRLKRAREEFEDAKAGWERVQNLPQAAQQLKERITRLNDEISHANQKIGAKENELRKLKPDLHYLSVEIGRRQDELARLEPEQRRIAVAERVNLVLEELTGQLRPMTSDRLEDQVTKHFLRIADKRFQGGRIRLEADGAPEIQFAQGRPSALLESLSGFEKRSFGIAFSLALAEITQRRVPLVIDTPLGNADSMYRPRTLRALTEFNLDQVIILTHDQEVTPDLLEEIEGKVGQKFLVEFDDTENKSVVVPDKFFGR